LFLYTHLTFNFISKVVWGFNEEVIKYVSPEGEKVEKERENSSEGNAVSSDSVTNRVAGMSLKYSLLDHKDAVTGVACFSRDNGHWMV
jgi:hypothetical protein